jgi:hypothetical protein
MESDNNTLRSTTDPDRELDDLETDSLLMLKGAMFDHSTTKGNSCSSNQIDLDKRHNRANSEPRRRRHHI